MVVRGRSRVGLCRVASRGVVSTAALLRRLILVFPYMKQDGCDFQWLIKAE
jgi:hypothetical protein